MYIKTTGLVLRETPYKESSRILTVLTATEGKITVSARGAKRKNSKTAAATQLLAFSDMTLFAERGRYTLTEAQSITMFEGLRDELTKLSLGVYFGELLEALSDEDIQNPEMLALGLNALYALSENLYPEEIIKAAFELRLMCLAGFEPMLSSCAVCGRSDIMSPTFSVTGGVVTCMKCRDAGAGEVFYLNEGTLAAMRHIVSCEPKKLYSFTVGESTQKQLSKVCEAYLTTQLGARFASLDYYHSVVV